MRSFYFTALIIVCTSMQLFSQKNLKNGYVITLESDTLYGFIEYGTLSGNTRHCIYRQTETSKPERFTPDDIKGYRFNEGKYFVSREIEKDGQKKSVFVEFLINGKVNIFSMKTELYHNYYIQKDDGALVLLKEIKTESRDESGWSEKTLKLYTGQLNYFMQDSKEAAKKLNQVSLNHASLINIAKTYHNDVCKDEACIVYEKSIPKNEFHLGPLAGWNYRSIRIDRRLYEVDFHGLSNFSYGMFFNIKFLLFSDRMSFQYNGVFDKISANIKELKEYEWQNDIEEYSLELNTFSNTLLVKYEFPFKIIQPFVQAGAGIEYRYNSEFTRLESSELNSVQDHLYDFYYSISLDEFYYNLNIGAGVSYKIKDKLPVFLEFNYLHSSDSGNMDRTEGFFALNMETSGFFSIKLGISLI